MSPPDRHVTDVRAQYRQGRRSLGRSSNYGEAVNHTPPDPQIDRRAKRRARLDEGTDVVDHKVVATTDDRHGGRRLIQRPAAGRDFRIVDRGVTGVDITALPGDQPGA